MSEVHLRDFLKNRKALTVFILAPLCMTIIRYFGNFDWVKSALNGAGMDNVTEGLISWAKEPGGDYELRSLTYWIIVIDIAYLVIPALVITFAFKQKISDYGLNFKLEKGWWKVYLLFMLVMIPLVVYFSSTSSFQERYPFYDFPKNMPFWPRFYIWELLYFSQFFCLEFFFRGFMVQGLKSAVGPWSIFIMTIPYCMIHFGKPLPETLSSIIAGIALGFLSYRSGGIMLGFLCHISVAISMDLMALWREGYF